MTTLVDHLGIAVAQKFLETRAETFYPNTCTFAMNRELFDGLGQFDPEYFVYTLEVDLGWRIRLAGYKVVMCHLSLQEESSINADHELLIFEPRKIPSLVHRYYAR